FPFDQNGLAPPQVDVGWRQVADALVISQVIVVGDEGLDLGFEIARRVIVFEQDAVFERRWIVGGKGSHGCAASPSQMGRFETKWLTAEKNLSALADLSRRWIDCGHSR